MELVLQTKSAGNLPITSTMPVNGREIVYYPR